MADRQYHLQFGPSASAAVDSYVEYKRMVGDDDGGKTFTPAEYEAYKKKVIPMRLKNRLFVSWSSPTGMDCKMIGPETECICGHRYRHHKTDFAKIPTERPILQPCRERGCKCMTYFYIPANGPTAVRCHCKHLTSDHSVVSPYACKKDKCVCSGYYTSFTCGCGHASSEHSMIVETKEERLARGHPVGQDVAYQAMGGLTGFSSLMDGYMRLDPSGAGAPSEEFLSQPITSSDHPFLRANVSSIRAHKMAVKAPDAEDDLAERMSAMKRPGESDMDFFERRYQERLKAEKAQARARPIKGSTVQRVGVRKTPGSGPSRAIAGPSTSAAAPKDADDILAISGSKNNVSVRASSTKKSTAKK